MARYTSAAALAKGQKARFERLDMTRKQGWKDLAEQMLKDAKELTAGTPTGKERLAQLKADGYPFGKGASAAESTPEGRRRGGGKGSLPLLPVGQISFRLRRALTVVKLGPMSYGLKAPGVQYASYVLGSEKYGDTGTKKMVSHGFRRVILQRFRARRKAFLDYYGKEQRRS